MAVFRRIVFVIFGNVLVVEEDFCFFDLDGGIDISLNRLLFVEFGEE